MPTDFVGVEIDGKSIRVPAGTTVAAAALRTGTAHLRRSVSGEARGPLCGMGICFECRVTVDGIAYARSCQIVCWEGMCVRTDD